MLLQGTVCNLQLLILDKDRGERQRSAGRKEEKQTVK